MGAWRTFKYTRTNNINTGLSSSLVESMGAKVLYNGAALPLAVVAAGTVCILWDGIAAIVTR